MESGFKLIQLKSKIMLLEHGADNRFRRSRVTKVPISTEKTELKKKKKFFYKENNF